MRELHPSGITTPGAAFFTPAKPPPEPTGMPEASSPVIVLEQVVTATAPVISAVYGPWPDQQAAQEFINSIPDEPYMGSSLGRRFIILPLLQPLAAVPEDA